MVKTNKKILALDYDGVIVNSKSECLFVGFNAYLKINPNTKLFNNGQLTFNNFENRKNQNKKIIQEYIKLRPYVIDAFCWYVILHIIENKIKVNIQNEYNKIRNSLMNLYGEYVKYFYEERNILQHKDFNKWLGLQHPFNIIKAIKKLKKKYIITIATNNREKSIRPFLDEYKIPVAIIADSTIGINKAKQIEFIKNKYNAKFSDIYFIDDQVAHFSKLLKFRVNCFLATWGYNNMKQRKEAKNIGVKLVTEKNFYKEILKRLPKD